MLLIFFFEIAIWTSYRWAWLMSRWDLLMNLWSVGGSIEVGLFIMTSWRKLALYWCICSSSIALEWESSNGIGDMILKADDRANFSVHFFKSVFVLFATVPLAKGKASSSHIQEVKMLSSLMGEELWSHIANVEETFVAIFAVDCHYYY